MNMSLAKTKSRIRFYKVVAIIVGIIYLFFFSSKWIIFNTAPVKSTGYGKVVTIPEVAELKIMGFNYSKNQAMAQVEAEVISLDDESVKTPLSFYAIGKNKFGVKEYAIETEIVLDKGNLKVINLKGINEHFKQISLIASKSNNAMNLSDENTGVFYISYNKVNEVSEIENHSYNYYLANSLKRNIAKKEKSILRNEKKIAKYKKQNESLNKLNSELSIQSLYLVGEEKAKYKEEKTNNSNEIAVNDENIMTLESENERLREEITTLKNNVKKLEE